MSAGSASSPLRQCGHGSLCVGQSEAVDRNIADRVVKAVETLLVVFNGLLDLDVVGILLVQLARSPVSRYVLEGGCTGFDLLGAAEVLNATGELLKITVSLGRGALREYVFRYGRLSLCSKQCCQFSQLVRSPLGLILVS